MEQPTTIPPYQAHDGESYPRPPEATADHIPVWHRFVDVLSGEMAEHISHWIVDPGPFGYLSQTEPIDASGRYVGNESVQCFNCGHPGATRAGTPYRRDGSILYLRCDDDPEYQEANRD